MNTLEQLNPILVRFLSDRGLLDEFIKNYEEADSSDLNQQALDMDLMINGTFTNFMALIPFRVKDRDKWMDLYKHWRPYLNNRKLLVR